MTTTADSTDTTRAAYLRRLAELVAAVAAFADTYPTPDGWGGGFTLVDHPEFGYSNTSDLLAALAAVIEEQV